MAQTNFTPISLYYSATSTNVPTAGNLVAGELAINTADGKLFYKDSSGVVQTIATKATAGLPTTTTGSGSIVLATSPTVTNPALGGSTSGSVTLAVPAVAGSNTATLPAATGTVMVSGNMPAFSAKSNALQAVTTSTTTKILFQSENFDTNNNFASSTFTPTVAGYYQLNVLAQTNYVTLKRISLYLYKNGSLFAVFADLDSSAAVTSSFNGTGGAFLVYANGSSDYFEVYGLLNGTTSAVNLGFYGDGGAIQYTAFSGTLVRTA